MEVGTRELRGSVLKWHGMRRSQCTAGQEAVGLGRCICSRLLIPKLDISYTLDTPNNPNINRTRRT